ncbi:MAG: hypothetical protein AB1454_02970 [Candidatus Auribacterota bacterium]
MDNDSIKLASELGRLDFVSALLAIIALFLALAAIPYYIFIYNVIKVKTNNMLTKKLTETEATIQNKVETFLAQMKDKVESSIIEEMETKIPQLTAEYFELARNIIDNDIANRIAGSQEIDENDE